MVLTGKLLLTLAVGCTGGILAKKAKFIPAAYMLGSLFFIVVLNLSTPLAYYPSYLRVLTQIIAGTYLGMRVDKENLSSIKSMAGAICLIMTMYMALALSFGYLMHVICGTDLLTSLYSFAPGGISDLGIIADGLGCDVGMITFMQLIRLITVFLFYPFLYQLLERKNIIQTRRNGGEAPVSQSSQAKANMCFKDKAKGLTVSLLFTAAAGLTGYFLGIPAGPLVFAMIMAIIVNIVYEKAYMPVILRYGAQIMSGVYLGLRISWDSIHAIFSSPVPVLMMIFSVMTFPLIYGFILHKLTKLELATCLIACTPGGMTEMTLLADDMGLDFVRVSVTHIARMVVTVMLFPYIFNFFILLVGP